MLSKNQSVTVAYIRGGTSKALFFHEHDIPAPGPRRDRFLRRIMGSPDPMQIDGMGGSHIVTSKVAIVAPSARPDADVDYTFAQIGIDNETVGYGGNCGNISAGVGPFAIDEGLVKTFRQGTSADPKLKTQEIRIYNSGTKKLLISHVPVDESGNAIEAGDFEIAGCPGTGAPILMDYRNVLGATLGRGALPTSKPVHETTINGKPVSFTVCDVGNMLVFAKAADFGLKGNESPKDIDADKALINRVKELRGQAAQLVGMCQDWAAVDEQSPMVPMVVLVSPAEDESKADIQSRLFLDNRCHTAMAGTGAICTAACSRIQGSIVQQSTSQASLMRKTYRIQHPLGIMPILADTDATASQSDLIPQFKTLSFVRTARRIMDGRIYVPNEIKDDVFGAATLPNGSNKANGTVGGKAEAVERNDIKARPNGVHTAETHESPTTALAEFVSITRFEDLDSNIVSALKPLLLDYIGCTAAATTEKSDSAQSFVNGIYAFSGGTCGASTVIARNVRLPAQYAALLNGATAHSLDFDDTHAAGALHPGVSVVSAALAEAEQNPRSSVQDFIAALAVGYETACRIGMALGTGGYGKGFHNTSVAGIFGAVAAIASLRNLDTTTTASAFGLALSKASGSMQYLANGSWNKRLHPGFAAHDAFLAVALAEAGTVGAAQPLEGKHGVLNLYSEKSDVAALLMPYESTWVFLETSVKPYPACRMTHGAIELAADMATRALGRSVKRITIKIAEACYGVVGERIPRKLAPQTVVDAQFSEYFQTAVSWLHGLSCGLDVYQKLRDPAVLSLSERIHVEIDNRYKGLETSMTVEWDDGTVDTEELLAPKGEPENPMEWETVRRKFEGLANSVFGRERVEAISTAVLRLESLDLAVLGDLLLTA